MNDLSDKELKVFKLFLKQMDYESIVRYFGVEKSVSILSDVCQIYDHNSFIGNEVMKTILNYIGAKNE